MHKTDTDLSQYVTPDLDERNPHNQTVESTICQTLWLQDGATIEELLAEIARVHGPVAFDVVEAVLERARQSGHVFIDEQGKFQLVIEDAGV